MRCTFLLALVILCFRLTGQSRQFDTSVLEEEEYAQRRNHLFAQLRDGKLDSAFLLAAEMLQRAQEPDFRIEHRIDVYSVVGNMLKRSKASQSSGKYFKEALILYEEQGFERSDYQMKLYASLAQVVEGNPESVQKALYYYRKAYELAESLDHTLLVSSMLNNIGIVYLATDRLDSAEYYFLRADSVYRNGDLPFNDLVMAINNNLADVAIRRNQYNEAISRLRENKNFTTYKGQPINEGIRAKRQARATSAITRVYLLKNKPDSASIVLKDFPQGTLNLLAPTEREELEAEYLYVKLLLAAATQNWAAYHSAQQVWESYRDSIQGRRTEAFATFTDAILNLQLVSAEQKLVMQEEVFTSKIERDRLTWFSIFIVCLLIIVLVGFRLSVVRNKAKRLKVEQELYRSELENAALKKEKLEARIKYQGADLGELSAELMLMRNLNNLAREKLREIKDLKPAEQTRNLQELDKSLAMSINLNKSRGLIHQHLEKVNTAFYSRLNKASVDKLSKGEQEVAALIRVRLSDAEIAELRATSVNAVYVARHRLKKKLGLSAQQNLEDFLRNV